MRLFPFRTATELGFLPDLAPYYSLLHNADGGKMEFIDILATSIVQGFGFSMGVLIVVSLIAFFVKRKIQQTKLTTMFDIFNVFKFAKLRGNKNG